MKILLVSNRYAPNLGSAENMVSWIAEELVARDHSVSVVCDPRVEKDRKYNGVSVITRAYPGDYDLMIIYGRGTNQKRYISLANTTKTLFYPFFSLNKTINDELLEGCGKATLLGSVTSLDREHLNALGYKDRTIHIPFGIPDIELPEVEKERAIVMVGGFPGHKHFQEVVNWWLNGHGLRFTWKLYLCGYYGFWHTSPDPSIVIVSDQGKEISYDDLQLLIAKSALLVRNTSKSAFGISILEAMRAGTAWRSTRTGAAADLNPDSVFKNILDFVIKDDPFDYLVEEGIKERTIFKAGYTIDHYITALLSHLNSNKSEIPGGKRPLISLTTNVKNEEMVLGRLLTSTKLLCEENIVVDTGSTDKTVEIAKEHGSKVAERVWRDNFDAAKNHCGDLARGIWKAHFGADEIFVGDTEETRNFLKFLPDNITCVRVPYIYSHDSVGRPLTQYNRPWFYRGNHRFLGWTHENLTGLTSENTIDYLGCTIHHWPKPGHLQQKVSRDLKVLVEECNRYHHSDAKLYYLGREYFYNKLWVEAIGVLERVLTLNNWDGEKAHACEMIADAYKVLGRIDLYLEYLHKAAKLDPESRNYWNALGMFYYHKADWKKAAVYLGAAASILKRIGEFHFIDKVILYRECVDDMLSVALYNIGDIERGLLHAERAMKLNPDDKRIINNVQLFKNALGRR